MICFSNPYYLLRNVEEGLAISLVLFLRLKWRKLFKKKTKKNLETLIHICPVESVRLDALKMTLK